MGEEASRLLYTTTTNQNDAVAEWELGLPSLDTLTPLSQSLIPPELAHAFKISPQPPRSPLDVTRASRSTLSSLRAAAATSNPNPDDRDNDEASESKRSRPIVDSSSDEIVAIEEDQSTAAAKTLNKRPRLVWTPQLHKRFVEVVAHLGLKNAVPKTIMQLMNVEGLTRENVASHLQKYRLYVKRMQGLSNEGPSPSDHLFASTPVPPQSLNESASSFGGGGGGSVGNGGNGNGNGGGGSVGGMHQIPIPMQYPAMPVPMMGMHGFHYPQQFGGGGVNVMQHQQQREWSGKYGNGYQNQSNQ